MVDRRWATEITVTPANSLRMIAWMISSVLWSMLAVASSRIRNFFGSKTTLAKQMSCFCPVLSADPAEHMSVSRPLLNWLGTSVHSGGRSRGCRSCAGRLLSARRNTSRKGRGSSSECRWRGTVSGGCRRTAVWVRPHPCWGRYRRWWGTASRLRARPVGGVPAQLRTFPNLSYR